MGDFLTQEQIDALLNQQATGGFGFEPEKPVEEVAVAVDSVDYSGLIPAFSIFCEQASGVLSTLLSRSVSFAVDGSQNADSGTVNELVDSPALVNTLPLTGAVHGEFYAVLSQKNCATLSDLMMMGDGTAAFCEDHRDATSELFNQVMGAFSTALGDRIGQSVSAGAIEVKDFSSVKPPTPYADAALVKISMHIDDIGDSTFCLLVPMDIAQEFIDLLGGSGMGSSGSGMMGLSSHELDDLSAISGAGGGGGFGMGGGMGGGGVTGGFAGGGFGGGYSGGGGHVPENVNMLLDIELDVAIELGRTDLSIKRILELAPGAIVELDRLAGEPVDLMVNNKVVAKGEVVVVDESFGIRIVSLVSPEDRIKSLK